MIRFIYFTRIVLFPFFRYVLPLFSKAARQRVDFELENHTHVPSLHEAEYGFEISSEGELEQVMVPLEKILCAKKTVELIFCSPSVSKQCLEIQKKFPNQVRLYRYPILTFNPLSEKLNPLKWLTCKKLYLCRYDMFPELVLYGRKADQFTLLSATLINFDSKNKLVQYYLKKCYKSFSKILAVTNNDKDIFLKDIEISADTIEVYDFRLKQIQKRLDLKEGTYVNKLPLHESLLRYIRSLDERSKIIFGSFWEHETEIFENISLYDDMPRQYFVAPHKLDELSIKILKEKFDKINVPYCLIDFETTEQELDKYIQNSKQQSQVWILNVKGVLCELYSECALAYVGGGFGESIHSVLEPFVSGCSIVVGPKNYRSTELKMIVENFPNKAQVAHKLSDVLSLLLGQTDLSQNEILSFNQQYNNKAQAIQTWLGVN